MRGSVIDAPGLWRRTFHPIAGFNELAKAPPSLGTAILRMLVLRVPVAYLTWAIAVVKFSISYSAFREMNGFVWGMVLPRLNELSPDLHAADLKAMLHQLPQLPSLGSLLAWGLLVAPLGILSLWLHDAVWDHGCLWLLGALKAKKGFRTSLLADAEALSVGVLGAILALLGDIPLLGLFLSLPLALVGLYFWILRGFSLSAFHGLPIWKGVTATVLHLLLAFCCLAGTLALAGIVFFLPVG
jgi:hypothetical protein